MTSPTLTSILAPNLYPWLSGILFQPPVGELGLSETEQRVMAFLSARLLDQNRRYELNLSQLYYDGMNVVPSLGISVPPELEPLRAVLGWCGAAVDARSERLTLQGFRMPDATEVDADLQQAWQFNNLDAESVLVHNDALKYGRSFAVVGVTERDGDPPLTTIESPLHMAVSWNIRDRAVSAAYQTYWDSDPASDTYNQQLATLYTRAAVIQLASDDKGWRVQERNDHNLQACPVIMFANNATTTNRYGCSEISPAWRNTQDRAARALVRNEAAAEFFASMKVWILGATEEAFRKADGTLATAWETFIGRISALEADALGNLPQIVFQQGQDPSGMLAFIDHERQMFSGAAAVPLEYLGAVSDGNPTSADAITKGDYRLMKRAQRLITQFGNCWEDWARLTLKVWRGGLPDDAVQIESDWERPTIPTPNADTVTVTTQIAAGMIPADSDDALAFVGWSPVQRARIEAARKKAQGNAAIDQALAAIQPQPPQQQPLDGEQPKALNALAQRRSGQPATTGPAGP